MAARLSDSGGADGEYRPLADINVTPLVDVMLVLLIIFMVAAPLMMVGVPLQLPKTSATPIGPPREPVIVSVTRDGAVYLGEEPLTMTELQPRLAALAPQDPETTVYVRGDQALAYGRVMEVIALVNQSGFTKVSLIAEGTMPATPVKAR
ncbi:MAG: ExbD/TolR family protein [Dongiaceae bacterium]